jgi:hypothetical protein
MNITVNYEKRQYGTGSPVRKYAVDIRETDGLYIENPDNPAANYYLSREVKIRFRAADAAPGHGWDHWPESGNAEVLGGSLELSHDAARQLAQAILNFLGGQPKGGVAEPLNFHVNEKPESREAKS